MPTENERKFVLRLDSEPPFAEAASQKLHIDQGYLFASRGLSLRLRKVEGRKARHIMTFKCSAAGRVVEIEKKIDRRDFEDVWPYCLNRLHKKRYILPSLTPEELWEVDFFKDHRGETYFAMAEVEMPEGRTKPRHKPEIVTRNQLFEVPGADCRFSNKMLGDIRHAMALYDSLLEQAK